MLKIFDLLCYTWPIGIWVANFFFEVNPFLLVIISGFFMYNSTAHVFSSKDISYQRKASGNLLFIILLLALFNSNINKPSQISVDHVLILCSIIPVFCLITGPIDSEKK